MTPQEQKAFEEQIYRYAGRTVCAKEAARDPVNEAMIRHWTEAMGDTNPAYTDPQWAAASRRGKTIAPPAMLYVWNQVGFPAATAGRPPDAQVELVNLFNEHGYTGVLGTNIKQDYSREISPGDTVYMETRIDNISARKATARGIGYFFETLATFTNQDDELIGTQRFRVLKFIPAQDQRQADSEEKLEVPTRIAAPRGHDNKWWWDACDEGRILIQRCKNCQTLRHPPRPMCAECQSMQWDSIDSALDGEILSYTELNHPRIPGYQYPLICVVVRLGEGTNLVANVVGCEPADVHIGMKVKGRVEQVDEKTMLPQFYPVEGGAA